MERPMWKTACLILFLLSAAFVVPSALLAIGFNGGIPTNAQFWLFLAIPLVPLYGWWRIKSAEVTSEDIKRSL
jgi:membrane protein implicated in regulation of membrane protease activity